MLIEQEHTVVNPIESEPSTSPFLESLDPQIQEWHEIFLNLLDVEKRYVGDDGITKDHIQRLADIYINKSMSIVPGQNAKLVKDKITTRQRAAVRRVMNPNKIIAAVEPTHNFEYLDFDDRTRVLNIYKELTQLQEEFREIHQSILNQGLKKENEIGGYLKAWLEADPKNFLELSDQIGLPTKASLRRFMAFYKDIDINKTAQKHKREVSENPSQDLLEDVFDQMGEENYRRKKDDQAWAVLELLIPIANQKIREMYEQDMDPTIRKKVLFSQFITQLQELGKPLPLILRSKIYKYIDDQFTQMCSKINQGINEYKPKANRKTPYEELIRMLSDEKPTDNTEQKPDSQSVEQPIKPEKSNPQTIVINNIICTDESSLRQNMLEFFQKHVKSLKDGYSSYIDAYVAIFSKMAGYRDNSPKPDTKKVKAIKPVNLSDGTKQPPMRMRLTSKDSPRIFYISHKGQTILLSASRHDDHTYDQLIKKGGFPDINLDSFVNLDN